MDIQKQTEFEKRLMKFAQRLINLVRSLPKSQVNHEYGIQVIRSGGSIGANYCEATEADSKVDFGRRIKICKRESKETNYWLRLLRFSNEGFNKSEFDFLIQESHEYVLIFSRTLQTSKLNVK